MERNYMDIQGGPKERNIYDLSYFRHQSYDIAFYSNYGRTLIFFFQRSDTMITELG